MIFLEQCTGWSEDMPPKKEKAGVTKNDKAEDKEATERNWLVEAWRRGGHTTYNPAAIAGQAVSLGLRTPAVMIAPKPEAFGPPPKTEAKKKTKDAVASSKKSAIAASAVHNWSLRWLRA